MYPADTDIVVDDENPDQDRPLTPRVRHSSSVSINEHPEYFEFDANSPPSTEPRADADVDPSSNPASEFSQRETAYGSMGVNYGGTSKRGQLGRSRSTSEVPETEKTGTLPCLACPPLLIPMTFVCSRDIPVLNNRMWAAASFKECYCLVFIV